MGHALVQLIWRDCKWASREPEYQIAEVFSLAARVIVVSADTIAGVCVCRGIVVARSDIYKKQLLFFFFFRILIYSR